jgi:hypothetical protein
VAIAAANSLTQAGGYIASSDKHRGLVLGAIPTDFAQEALSALWIDSDFPKLLGAELYRPHPTYVAELAIEPVVVHDFSSCLAK